eukprot:1991529-Pyramimonas_sp.AAC.1
MPPAAAAEARESSFPGRSSRPNKPRRKQHRRRRLTAGRHARGCQQSEISDKGLNNANLPENHWSPLLH